MSDEYVTISSSTRHLTKKFMVLDQQRTRKRAQAVEDLTGGGIHISTGRKRMHYTLKLMMPYSTTDPDIGTLADLDQFFKYVTPTASPSDMLFVTMHDGVERTCKLLGDMPDIPEGVLLDGVGAWYSVDVELAEFVKQKAAFNTTTGSQLAPVLL